MAKKKIKKEPDDILKKDSKPIEKKPISEAHVQADKDIDQDPDLNLKTHREDDLDEGELARLEGGD